MFVIYYIISTFVLSSVLYDTIEKPSYDYLKSVTVEINGSSRIGMEIIAPETVLPYGELLTGVLRWEGTGIVICSTTDYTYVLTNAHVAGKQLPTPKLTIKSGKDFVPAILVKHAKDKDMAIIKVQGRIIGKRAIKGLDTVKPSDRIYLVGHHLGRAYTYGEGVMAGYEEEKIIFQVPVMWGNSGSGVFNQRGKLVGLIFAISIRPVGMIPVVDVAHGIAVSIEDIKEFIDEYLY